MKYNFDFEDVVATGAIIIIIVVVIWGCLYGLQSIRSDRACLAKGYREATVDYTLTAYCIRRTDQSDIVVRLDSLP